MKNALFRLLKGVAVVAMLIGSYLLLLYILGGGYIMLEDYLLAGALLFGGLGAFLLIVFKGNLPASGKTQRRALAALGWATAMAGALLAVNWLLGGNLLHQILGIYLLLWGSALILFNSVLHPSRSSSKPSEAQG